MAKYIDLTGKKYGKLTPLKPVGKDSGGHITWECVCDCQKNLPVEQQKTIVVSSNHLRMGHTKSCGCYHPRSYAKSNGEYTRRPYKSNHYIFFQDYAIGYTDKQEEYYIDLDDYEKIKNYYWRIDGQGYVVTNNSENRQISQHRFIMPNNSFIDHIDGNRSNNRKSNLRIVTRQQNNMNKALYKNNKSGHKGVRQIKNKWEVQITYNSNKIRLGTYDNINEAIAVREQAEQSLFGNYSRSKDNL